MNTEVVVFVFYRDAKKKSNVYKIEVLSDNHQPSQEEILKCDNNFTLNPNVALFIAHSEAKKLNRNYFKFYYINDVANFVKKESKTDNK